MASVRGSAPGSLTMLHIVGAVVALAGGLGRVGDAHGREPGCSRRSRRRACPPFDLRPLANAYERRPYSGAMLEPLFVAKLELQQHGSLQNRKVVVGNQRQNSIAIRAHVDAEPFHIIDLVP